MTISEIFIYPIKSLAGISLPEAKLSDRGLQYDRRWMLIDQNGRFISQRKFPKMALLQPEINGEKVIVRHKSEGIDPLIFSTKPETDTFITGTVWGDACLTQRVSDQADAWFSDVLQTDCLLVFMPNQSRRPVAEKHAVNREITSLSDGVPHLIIGKSSLDSLNSSLDVPVPMDRFRTNFVFTGGPPYIEDGWKKITIGKVIFHLVTQRGRCTMTNVNQDSGVMGREPFLTLSKTRNTGEKVIFGMGMVHEGEGDIKIGDPIEVLA